jgi:hypothetical protein
MELEEFERDRDPLTSQYDLMYLDIFDLLCHLQDYSETAFHYFLTKIKDDSFHMFLLHNQKVNRVFKRYTEDEIKHIHEMYLKIESFCHKNKLSLPEHKEWLMFVITYS